MPGPRCRLSRGRDPGGGEIGGGGKLGRCGFRNSRAIRTHLVVGNFGQACRNCNHRRVRRAKPLRRLQLKQTRADHTEHRKRQRRAKKVAVVKRYSTRLRHDSPAGKILRIDLPAGI